MMLFCGNSQPPKVANYFNKIASRSVFDQALYMPLERGIVKQEKSKTG